MGSGVEPRGDTPSAALAGGTIASAALDVCEHEAGLHAGFPELATGPFRRCRNGPDAIW